MRKILFNYKEPMIVLLSLLLLAATGFASGYYLDPMFLGFIFTPVIGISLSLLSLFFTMAPAFSLTRKVNRNVKTMKAFLACIFVWLFILLSPIPGSNEGVAYRLGDFSEQDYKEISSIVDDAYEVYGNNAKFFSRGSKGYDAFIRKLKENHEIFNVSEFPLDVLRNETYIAIEWASGLTGGYELVIFEQDKPPYWLDERNVHYIYDTVAFYNKS